VNALQLWVEGYKFRGESCKQGGIVSAVLIAFLAASIKNNPIPNAPIPQVTLWAIVVLSFGIGFSALTYLLLGRAITQISYDNSNKEDMMLSDLFDISTKKYKTWKLPASNFFGVCEMFCLIGGLILVFFAI
jgi:hypothetical protein